MAWGGTASRSPPEPRPDPGASQSGRHSGSERLLCASAWAGRRVRRDEAGRGATSRNPKPRAEADRQRGRARTVAWCWARASTTERLPYAPGGPGRWAEKGLVQLCAFHGPWVPGEAGAKGGGLDLSLKLGSFN